MIGFGRDSGGSWREVLSPVALGLISDPPTIVLSYDVLTPSLAVGNNGKRKRRKRKMPLRDFTDRSNVKRYVFNLRQRHGKYLQNVIDVHLEKMLRIIQEIQKGNSVARSVDIVNEEYFLDPEEDLNVLSSTELAQRKSVMDEVFHKNLIKPGDPEFVYDKVVAFETGGDSADNDWDEGEEENEEDLKNVDNQKKMDEGAEGVEFSDNPCKDKECPEKQVIRLAGDSDILDIKHNQYLLLDKVEMKFDSLNLQMKQDVDEAHLEGNEVSINEKGFGISFEPVVTQIHQGEGDSTKPKVKEGNESETEDSSTHLGEALDVIETGIVEEEDEFFWQ